MGPASYLQSSASSSPEVSQTPLRRTRSIPSATNRTGRSRRHAQSTATCKGNEPVASFSADRLKDLSRSSRVEDHRNYMDTGRCSSLRRRSISLVPIGRCRPVKRDASVVSDACRRVRSQAAGVPGDRCVHMTGRPIWMMCGLRPCHAALQPAYKSTTGVLSAPSRGRRATLCSRAVEGDRWLYREYVMSRIMLAEQKVRGGMAEPQVRRRRGSTLTELLTMSDSAPASNQTQGQDVAAGTTSKTARNARGRPTDDPDTRHSKTLSYILRHGAAKEGLTLRPDGFVRVSDLVSRALADCSSRVKLKRCSHADEEAKAERMRPRDARADST